jgi:hypothetical protein
MTDGQRSEYTRFAWAGGTFFLVVLYVVSLLQPEKKVLVICLAGARSLLRLEKKVQVVCLAGARSLLRPEKKVLVMIFT